MTFSTERLILLPLSKQLSSGTDNNMLGINSFVELRDTDMRISDWWADVRLEK